MRFVNPSSGHRALRRHRLSNPDQIYFITIVCHDRERIFFDHENAQIAARIINDANIWSDSRLIAWVLMPDHLHLLLQLGQRYDLSSLVQRLKSITTKKVRSNQPTLQKVWQAPFHEHSLKKEEDVESLVRYLLNNPIRAGLVTSLADYPYWNVCWDISGGHTI